jgi:hypothetical protein
LKEYRKLSDKDVHGFLGLIEVDNDYYISVITGSTQVASPVKNETINKIYSVDFFSITKSTYDSVDLDSNGIPIRPDQDDFSRRNATSDIAMNSNGQNQKHPCFDLKKLLSTGGFYFSTDFDLTSTLQSRGVGGHSLSFDKFNTEYMWNSFMLQEVIEFRNKLDAPIKEKLDDEGFLTTVIRGFAETTSTYLDRLRMSLTVISRQSWKRAGTRFNSRGVDDDSYVSNFVETELILYSDKLCYSYSQIRGSIPIFWEQDTALINPKVQITRSQEATQPIFDKHFKRLLDTYGAVNVVNLLSTKSSEIQLSNRYKSHLRALQEKDVPDLYLTQFDFHKETSDQGYSSSTKIYNLIKESLYEFGYFSHDVTTGQTLSEQSGIFRTNCLDCLDRTNLIQQFISNFALTIFLKDHGFRVSQESEFINRHNTLWANNGDQISQIYTGTNALKSSFSRSGKMSFAGALSDATKSVSRMYINNFVDKGKQLTIDTLLGRLSGQVPVLLYDPITDYVNEKIKKNKSEYTSNDNINVFAGTYNVNGLSRPVDLSEWLYPIGDKFKPNIVVLGFQEVIELTAGSILNADYSKSSFWTNEVSKCLNQFDKYVMLRAEQMSSLLLLFFVRADCINDVKQVEGSVKKTGLGGMTGNKGAVAIRFNYGSSSFCFVNVHLAAGTEKVQERNNDYFAINNGIKFSRGGTIEDNQSIFWIGDLNYRISLSSDEVRSRLDAGDYEYLSNYDQLTNEINRNNAFKGYAEPTLNFKPTYKYDKGTHTYDSSEKQRTPSWTDRIIYKGDFIKPLAYNSSDSLVYSDHKPVYGAYKANVEFVDDEKKLEISRQIYENYKQTHSQDSDISLLDFSTQSKNENVKDIIQNGRSVETPNFVDIEDDYKPQLPSRKDPIIPIYTDVLTPKRNTPTPPPPPKRLAGGPPPLPGPRSEPKATPSSESTSTITSSTSSPSSPPSKPASRKLSAPAPPPPPQKRSTTTSLPPGFSSDSILQPKSSATSTRSSTPLPPPPSTGTTLTTSIPSSPVKPPIKSNESLTSGIPVSAKKTPPIIPKKPSTLAASATGPRPDVLSAKQDSLSAVSIGAGAPKRPAKPSTLKNLDTDAITYRRKKGPTNGVKKYETATAGSADVSDESQ